ncbi:MAG TPA: hypothetical protein VHS59_10555 [Bacillota bacterium]|nr:hypothetical protein [Bacillota bacterium]
MKELRCSCKKLVCQIDGDTIIFKCRHCKSFVLIHTQGIVKMEYRIEQPTIDLSFLGHPAQKHA